MDPTRTVSDVCSNVLWRLTPDTGVASARRMAANSCLRHMLVIEDGDMVGVVTARQLRQALPRALVRDLMQAPVLCVSPEETVAGALQIMAENDVGYLPVVSQGYVIGAVTDDLLQGRGHGSSGTYETRLQPEA